MAETTKQRGNKRVLTGTVTSNRMEKTITVTVSRRVKHPLYKKYLVRKSKFKAHDEKNECNIGDRVEIIEHRPISKMKRWKLQRILDRAAGS